MDNLLILEGIGAQRAVAILKLGDKKGYIALKDVEENLQNTTATLQKLLTEEKISFEIPATLIDSIKEIKDEEQSIALDNVSKDLQSR